VLPPGYTSVNHLIVSNSGYSPYKGEFAPVDVGSLSSYTFPQLPSSGTFSVCIATNLYKNGDPITNNGYSPMSLQSNFVTIP
jgi:hypothetical protein